MTEQAEAIASDKQLQYAEKIAKLLRLAENASTQAEADAFNGKAQEIMRTWAITDDLIAQAQGKQRQVKVIEKTIKYTGTYHRALYEIGAAIARANHCKVLITKHPYDTILYVIGFEDDVAKVEQLNASLQIQASTGMQRYGREDRERRPWLSKMEQFKAKREWLFGFGDGLYLQLRAAIERGERAASEAEAARANVDLATASKSTALVVRTRDEQVKDWMDTTYGKSLRSVRSNYSYGGGAARSAGQAAGRNADTGQSRIGGTRSIGGRS